MTSTDLHPHVAKINATCPAYYSAVADEYVALLGRGATEHVAMRDCFYSAPTTDRHGNPLFDASFIHSLSDEPTRGERMLVRQLAEIPTV